MTTEVKKLAMRYEGKAKKVYDTDREDYFWIEYKDDATAFNGLKKGTIADKGVINNQMSALLFTELEQAGVPTHFVEQISDREMLVKRLEMLPLEVVVRNVVAGSLQKRLGVPEGTVLSQPVVELYYKDDALGDPLVNESHIRAMGWANEEEVNAVQCLGQRVNALLQQWVNKAGIELIDFKLEFGKVEGKIVLGDEISPDTCRFWDIETKEKLDKDRFRRDLGGVEEAYVTVFQRIKEGLGHA